MFLFNENKNETKEELEELEDLQSKVKQVRLVENLGKQSYHYDIKELFETITNALTDNNQNLFEASKATTKAIMEPGKSNKYGKILESKNRIEVILSSLIRPEAKLLVPKNKSQFRLLGDPDSDNWND